MDRIYLYSKLLQSNPQLPIAIRVGVGGWEINTDDKEVGGKEEHLELGPQNMTTH